MKFCCLIYNSYLVGGTCLVGSGEGCVFCISGHVWISEAYPNDLEMSTTWSQVCIIAHGSNKPCNDRIHHHRVILYDCVPQGGPASDLRIAPTISQVIPPRNMAQAHSPALKIPTNGPPSSKQFSHSVVGKIIALHTKRREVGCPNTSAGN